MTPERKIYELEQFRKRRYLTIKRVAKMLGVKERIVYYYLSGKIEIPDRVIAMLRLLKKDKNIPVF